MRRITKAAMALGAILALGVLPAGAAQAHTFLSSTLGSGLLLVLGEGPQTFTASEGGVSIICQHVILDGTVKESGLTATARGFYTGCQAAGTFAAKVSAAEFEFSADETVSVKKAITIEVAAVGCTITIGTQSLSKIRYLTDPKSPTARLLAHAEVKGIQSTITGGGGACGEEGPHANGTYFGLVLAYVDGGTLSWS